MPYIIKYFDGTDTEAGLCLAANMGAYALSVMGVGRTQVWYYRRWVFFSTQGLMLVGMTGTSASPPVVNVNMPTPEDGRGHGTQQYTGQNISCYETGSIIYAVAEIPTGFPASWEL